MRTIQRTTLIICLSMCLSLLVTGCKNPGSSGLDIPDAELDTCQTDQDCVVVLRVDECCACPEVTTHLRLETTEGIEQYIPGQNYGELKPAICAQVRCAACPAPPAGVICEANACRAPETVEEIFTRCPDCFEQAALAAYISGDLQQAAGYCQQSVVEKQYACFFALFNEALATDQFGDAEQVCRQHLTQDVSGCLYSLAIQWGATQEQYALGLCAEIPESDARHFNCVLKIALAVREHDQGRALEICESLPAGEAEMCRQEVLQ